MKIRDQKFANKSNKLAEFAKLKTEADLIIDNINILLKKEYFVATRENHVHNKKSLKAILTEVLNPETIMCKDVYGFETPVVDQQEFVVLSNLTKRLQQLLNEIEMVEGSLKSTIVYYNLYIDLIFTVQTAVAKRILEIVKFQIELKERLPKNQRQP